MARTYSSTPVMSKIKIGDSVYYLKDADARGILDGINADVYESLKLALGTVAGGGDNLVTAGSIKEYVDEIAELGFDVVKLNVLPTADAQAYAEYHNNIVLIEDPDAASGACIEYIIMRTGNEGSYVYAWEKIGSTKADLSDYVSNVGYVDNTHTLTQTKGGIASNVHVFGDMADADQGEVDLSNYVKNVSAKVIGAGALEKDNVNGVQISGSIADLTVIDSVGSAPSFSEGAFVANVPTALDLSKFDGGNKVADQFTANTPTALDLTKFNGGSKVADTFVAPTFSEGAFTPASLTTQTKALYKQGVTAHMGSGESGDEDEETLIIENVQKEADIKVVDQFNGGSKAADSFTAGSYQEGAFTPASLAEGFYSAGSAAQFTEGAYTPASLAEGFYSAGSAASKAADTFNAGAVPTTKSVTPVFTGDKFKFVGSEVDASVTLTKGGTEIVNPKAEE